MRLSVNFQDKFILRIFLSAFQNIYLTEPTLEAFNAKDGETFGKLEWRLEALLQTRGEHVREIQPLVWIKLNEDITFDADVKTLDDLAFQLEGALVKMKCPLVKKLQKFL